MMRMAQGDEDAMEEFHVCHWDDARGHEVCHTEWRHAETEIDLEMVAFPLLTGGIGYEVDGARVSLDEEDFDMAFDYLVDTRESEPFVWSVRATDNLNRHSNCARVLFACRN